MKATASGGGRLLKKEKSMKRNIFAIAVIGIMAGTLLLGCGKKSGQKVEEGKENIDSVKQQLKDVQAGTLADWQAFKAESELKILANEKRIGEFKEKIKAAGPKVEAKYSKDVVALELKNTEMKKKLAEYKDERQSKWDEFKADFDKDMDGIGKTLEDLFKANR
jgi:hypothetical protein